MGDAELCAQCGHDSDEHLLVSTSEAPDGGPDPMGGGIRLCPVLECKCYATWDVAGGPIKRIPDQGEVTAIREHLQRRQDR